MKQELKQWAENMIVADADYVSRVAFNLIVNFERMLGRRIPPADLARWLECVALDGGLRGSNHEIGVVLVHEKDATKLENFQPDGYEAQLNGKAFMSALGEFTVNAVAVESFTTKEQLMADIVEMLVSQGEVRRLAIVPNAEEGDTVDRLRRILQRAEGDRVVTLLAMQPLMGSCFRQEILGYSLMQAMGIRGDELGGGQ
jgi:hypothetical protein